MRVKKSVRVPVETHSLLKYAHYKLIIWGVFGRAGVGGGGGCRGASLNHGKGGKLS